MALKRSAPKGKFCMGPRLNTITNTTLSSSTFNGNGVTVDFATGFQFINNADLQVIVTSSAGVETVKTITTHYTVTGAGSPSGGTVTFLVAPASGEKVNIRSNVTLDQQTDYQEGGSFAASTHETALDKLTKITQQVKEITDRCVKLPISNQSITTQAANPTAEYVLGVNAGGTALEWKSPSTISLGTTVTAFAETLLDDAAASDARTTLGLGTMSTQAASSVAITGGSVTGITDITLADGGTGASLADPNADRIMFWDDSAGQVTWLSPGTNLSITGTTLDAASTATNTFGTIAVSGQSDVVADSTTDTLTLAEGAGITITTNAGTDTITIAASGASAATQAEQETGSSTSVFVSPGRQQYHASAAKAWVLFTSVTTTAITSSYNVTSLTDNGTGDTTVNFTTAFSSGNYGYALGSGTGKSKAGTQNQAATFLDSAVAPTTTAFRMYRYHNSNGVEDVALQSAVFFGDQ